MEPPKGEEEKKEEDWYSVKRNSSKRSKWFRKIWRQDFKGFPIWGFFSTFHL